MTVLSGDMWEPSWESLFLERWTELILRCITTVKYKIKLNGNLTSEFTPSRDIQQGDPLSPYIYVICAQGFSSLLNGLCAQKLIKGLRMANRGPIISHLFFGNDSLILFKADPYSCLNVKEAITTYEDASGQLINFDKSALTFSPNTLHLNQTRVKQILGIKESKGHNLYLGAPSFS